MQIDVQELVKRLGGTTVLERINMEIRDGEFLGLLGPSGSGKTTLLRILAGLETASEGRVLFDGEDVLTRALDERQVGFVFQHYALFRHMRVLDNVAFGLQVRPRDRRPAREAIAKRANELLELVQLKGFADRFPSQLSGGQRQRVALARALAIDPKVLLLDEPFGALDAKVRIELRHWLRELHETMGITTVFVTHDQEEALELADRVAVMNRGRIEQIGTPQEIYEAPATIFVYDFLGTANRFDCRIENGRVYIGDKVFLVDSDRKMPDGPAAAYVRPHDIVLCPVDARPESADATLPGTAVVRHVAALGPRASVELSYEGHFVEAEISRDALKQLDLSVGARCAIQVKLPCVFPRPEDGEGEYAAVGVRRSQKRRTAKWWPRRTIQRA